MHACSEPPDCGLLCQAPLSLCSTCPLTWSTRMLGSSDSLRIAQLSMVVHGRSPDHRLRGGPAGGVWEKGPRATERTRTIPGESCRTGAPALDLRQFS